MHDGNDDDNNNNNHGDDGGNNNHGDDGGNNNNNNGRPPGRNSPVDFPANDRRLARPPGTAHPAAPLGDTALGRLGSKSIGARRVRGWRPPRGGRTLARLTAATATGAR
jgi:hypothetical protein